MFKDREMYSTWWWSREEGNSVYAFQSVVPSLSFYRDLHDFWFHWWLLEGVEKDAWNSKCDMRHSCVLSKTRRVEVTNFLSSTSSLFFCFFWHPFYFLLHFLLSFFSYLHKTSFEVGKWLWLWRWWWWASPSPFAIFILFQIKNLCFICSRQGKLWKAQEVPRLQETLTYGPSVTELECWFLRKD
jgi:hypothetical protein